jgi:hypothetical protein
LAKLHFVKRARKDYKDDGIKKGDSYWWIKPMIGGRGGAVRRFKDKPRQSQIESSDYLQSYLSIEESVEDITEFDGAADTLDELANEMEALGEEQEEKATNMEEHFPNGSEIINMLRERAECCSNTAESMRSAVEDINNLDADEEDFDGDHAVSEILAGIDWQS